MHSQVLQDVLLTLDKSYQAFFKKLARYPKFKRKGRYNSFSYPQYGRFRFKEDKLILPCIGAIEIKMHCIPIGTLKRCTVIRDVDQWYCCITADDGIDSSTTKFDSNPVGIDVGLLNWITLSDGKQIQNTLTLQLKQRSLNNCNRTYQEKRRVQRIEREGKDSSG